MCISILGALALLCVSVVAAEHLTLLECTTSLACCTTLNTATTTKTSGTHNLSISLLVFFVVRTYEVSFMCILMRAELHVGVGVEVR